MGFVEQSQDATGKSIMKLYTNETKSIFYCIPADGRSTWFHDKSRCTTPFSSAMDTTVWIAALPILDTKFERYV